MPSSSVRTFTDPDDYASSIRAAAAEMLVTGQGSFAAKITRIDLRRLWMQRFVETLPRTIYSAQPAGRVVMAFRTRPGPSLRRGGVEMGPADISLSEGASFYQHSSGAVDFASMSLPTDQMIAAIGEATGRDLIRPGRSLMISPRPAAMARLLRLHTEAAELATNAPDIIADADAAHGLEQALLHAALACLDDGPIDEDRASLRQHQLIMRRFHRLLEARPDGALYLPAVCETIGVTERTLRRCCHEQFGMGPMRFLLLRRMHLARRALRAADPSAANVTAIAMQFGFWELGRFAVAYRSLFGEPPSATLRQPMEQSPSAERGMPQILTEIA